MVEQVQTGITPIGAASTPRSLAFPQRKTFRSHRVPTRLPSDRNLRRIVKRTTASDCSGAAQLLAHIARAGPRTY